MKPFLGIYMAFLRLISGTTCWNLLFLGYRLHEMYKPDHNSFRIQCWSRRLFPAQRMIQRRIFETWAARLTERKFIFPTAKYPRKNVFSLKSWCIGCLATIVVRGKRTPDSCSSPLETTWEHHFAEILVYRLPSNHCGPEETDVGFVFLTSGNHLGTPFRWNPGVSVA